MKNPAYEDFLLGNINRDSLVDLPRRPNFARMLADIRAGVEMCRERCEYFSVCGGGEPVNKLAENGTFASTETTYCRLTKMRATDLVLDALERVRPSGSSPWRALPTATERLRMSSVDSEDRMNNTFRRLAVFAVAAAMQGGLVGLALAQATPAQPSVGGPPPQYAAPGSEPAAVPAAAPEAAAAIRAAGALRDQRRGPADQHRSQARHRAGDRVGELAGLERSGTGADIRRQALWTMSSICNSSRPRRCNRRRRTALSRSARSSRSKTDHPFKGVRVRASENTIEVKPIPGLKQADISVDSCKDCIGKKFAERGQAPAGQASVVRQEDLPKILRWIIPSRGIRGITHNPNRLNLILGDDNTIVQAYWE